MLPAWVEEVHIVGVRERRTLLEAIVINDKRQIIEAKLGGRHNRFPVRAFLHLAVAGHHIGVVIGARKLGGFGHADRNRRPWPSGPVLVSTPGTLLQLGWPFRRELGCRKVEISSSE